MTSLIQDLTSRPYGEQHPSNGMLSLEKEKTARDNLFVELSIFQRYKKFQQTIDNQIKTLHTIRNVSNRDRASSQISSHIRNYLTSLHQAFKNS